MVLQIWQASQSVELTTITVLAEENTFSETRTLFKE